MVRPNRRKGIEEVYGTKLEAMQPAPRLQVIPQPGMTKTATMRVASSRQGDNRTQRSYVTANDYYITTNVPLNTTNMRAAPSGALALPSKQSQMPVQSQAASTQILNYGSLSNRRFKPSARHTLPVQSAKVHFVPTDSNKQQQCHGRPHAHNHPYAKPSPVQMTQRTVYAVNSDLDANLTELSDKDQMHSANILNSRRAHVHSHPSQNQTQHSHTHPHPQAHPHPHPLQHQLHQQQQLSHQSNTNSNNNSNNMNMHQQHHHSHPNMKHQQQQQLQQQLQQQQLRQQQLQQQRVAAHSHQRAVQMGVGAEEEEEEKDEDPEEFFELIRQTVKKAVGTTIQELVTRNFRDLASKMERFSNELKMTNENLGKLQNEVTNKVMHYGEENTRHFRYLCMKSEYDKMFYQHQTMAAGKQPPSKTMPAPLANSVAPSSALPSRVAKQAAAFNLKSGKQMSARKIGHANQKKVSNECGVKVQNPCACRSTSKSSHQPTVEAHQTSSEQSVNVKSSELGVREVLGQIQRFCTQMQLGDIKEEQSGHTSRELCTKPSSASGNVPSDSTRNSGKSKAHMATSDPPADGLDMEMETPVDSMDEIEIDNFQYSSDEMSSYSDDDSEVKFSGSTTARAPLQSSRHKLPIQLSNKGAGDGQ